MLEGRMRADAVRTRVGPLEASLLAPFLGQLEAEARAELGDGEGLEAHRHVQLRYLGQEHTLEVPVPEGLVDDAATVTLRASFDRASEEAYAFSLEHPVELVAARVAVSAASSPFSWHVEEPGPARALGPRVVDLDEHGGVVEVPVLHRGSLEPGPVAGPAIVEEAASTTLVLPGQTLTPDEHGNLVIEEVR
jgi:N-methylhydantoinase A